MSCTNAAVSDATELPVSSDALTPVAQRQAMELHIKQLKAGAGFSEWFIDLHVYYRKKLQNNWNEMENRISDQSMSLHLVLHLFLHSLEK